ncbi:MAG: hypothetical protein P8N43_15085, partial [Alphaproteobacteria bacterium]|nr:hypothetical protein [Alphaproteobacteria bacterium]
HWITQSKYFGRTGGRLRQNGFVIRGVKNMRKLWMTTWLLITVTSYAVLPPEYLSVPHFKQCLSTADQGTWQSWCVPLIKPKDCPCSSWLALQNSQKAPPQCKQPLSIWKLDYWRAQYQIFVCRVSSGIK